MNAVIANRDHTVTVESGSGQSVTFNPNSPTSLTYRSDDGATLQTLLLTDEDAVEASNVFLPLGAPVVGKTAWDLLLYALWALSVAGMSVYGNRDLTLPLPAGIPDGSKFFFGNDGGDYYLSETGQLWKNDATGASLVFQLPLNHGEIVGTDGQGICRWQWYSDRVGSGSAASRAYQEQITGVPVGLECVMANGTAIEGYNYQRNVFLDAKYGYEGFFQQNGQPETWYENSLRGDLQQMLNQINGAGGRMVEWHFSSERIANIYQGIIFGNSELRGKIVAIYTPVRP